MFTKYPDGTWACSSVIRATDLITIANQIFKDNMQYVHISVKSSEDEGQDGLVEISAIPSASSDDVKNMILLIFLLLLIPMYLNSLINFNIFS